MAALVLAGATVVGIVTQSIARWLRVPGIVLLLIAGMLLGPDALGVVRPELLGGALSEVVGFSVSVILFVGGMHIDVSRFRAQHKAIRRLVTIGALVTAVGATLTARLILGWEWRLAALFGCLVIVTGPTVVSPLVRRLELVPSVADILEVEAVLIDAIGAVVAVVALEVALEPSLYSVQHAASGLGMRLVGGALLGVGGGLALGGVLRYRNLIADGLENVFTLAMVWGLYKGADVLLSESGIVAVTVAGMVLGNLQTRVHDDLVEFKDQLTVLLIGTLFVLLAAEVQLADLAALGWPAAWTVAALVLVVRPMSVLASTWGSPLGWRERLFVSSFAPRGIIAAAVASLFTTELAAGGHEGGQKLNAMVFVVIVSTVVLAGVTGRPLAQVLGLLRERTGWIILGANPLALELARALSGCGEQVLAVDRSGELCRRAEALGIPSLHGNGLEEEVLVSAGVALRSGAIGATPNNEINLLFIEKANELASPPHCFVALNPGVFGASRRMVHAIDGGILFGGEVDLALWNSRIVAGEIAVLVLTAGSVPSLPAEGLGLQWIPLVHRRGRAVMPVADTLLPRSGDVLHVLVERRSLSESLALLARFSWRPPGEARPVTLDHEPRQ